jgi:hypothetical protein
LKFGLDGIEVTSQVIGFLVLTLSVAFFYLYVSSVYPMRELELQRHAESTLSPPEPKADTPTK